jgi:hypothetical protein
VSPAELAAASGEAEAAASSTASMSGFDMLQACPAQLYIYVIDASCTVRLLRSVSHTTVEL